jgi:hypothetical protein
MNERAVPLDLTGVAWSAGSPEPFIISSEQRTFVGFFASDDGSRPAGSLEVIVVELAGCTSVRFGFPNDEALHGHPLYGAGLTHYQLHEVEDSAWLTQLRTAEAVHAQAPEVPFSNARHFVFTFHDTTLETIAKNVRLVGSYASRAEAVEQMATMAGLS